MSLGFDLGMPQLVSRRYSKGVTRCLTSGRILPWAAFLCFGFFSQGSAWAAQPVPVSAQPLDELVVFPEVSAPASVLSLNDSRISAQVNARVLEVPIRVGDVVSEGAVLARLDGTDYQLQVAQTQASLRVLAARIELAQYQLERKQKLMDTGDVSEEEVKRHRTEVASLLGEREAQEAVLARARADLERTTLRAPFGGVVMERLAQVGELVSPGAPVVRLLDLDSIEVSARIRTEDVATLDEVRDVVFAVGGVRYPLTLRAVAPAVDNRDRSQEVRLSFSGERPLPGTAGRLSWRSDVPHLPPGMVLSRGGRLGVFVVDDGEQPRARFVPLEQAREGRAAPLSDTLEGLLVTDGRFRLQDGDPVKVD
ncbi:efflux RND transporter periplasmic adaptor subunit [Alkalilimnicola ehrlichii]|nr:efflux RND transporter periplasmic adaptor subunit [Alkalilimnicola ehrlichii]